MMYECIVPNVEASTASALKWRDVHYNALLYIFNTIVMYCGVFLVHYNALWCIFSTLVMYCFAGTKFKTGDGGSLKKRLVRSK